MDEATREARRKALAEEVARLKRAADSNASAPVLSNAPTASGESSEEEADDELDWDLEPGADQRMSVSSADVSDPNLDALDSSWDDEEEEEEPEPELPDERLDPVAYAEAKAAREERARARRERKRAKDAAKRARQKQRALEAKRKQKSKSKKPRVSAAPKAPAKSAAKIERAKTIEAALDTSDVGEPEIREVSSPKKSRAIEKKSGLSPTSAWVLAVIVLVFIGAIGFAFFRAR
jgi:cobalamin biosynthesis Mg chelatase CobN